MKLPFSISGLYRLALCGLYVLYLFDVMAQENILQARQRPLGSVVTIKGIVLNGAELGAIRYLQDSTAGIAVYPGGSSPSSFEQVTTSDEVQVTGVLSSYHGLLEINPILTYQKLTSGNPLPEPIDKDPDALAFHDQGRLVRISCVRFLNAPGTFDSGNQPIYTAKGEKAFVYLEGNHPLSNSVLPDQSVNLVVIASHFDEPRFLIRTSEDYSPASCFHIIPAPRQSLISQQGFQLEWSSSEDATGFCILKDELGGTDTFQTDFIAQHHAMQTGGLKPAEFYDVQAGAVNLSGDTTMYAVIPMSTKSASSGSIAIYFNQSIDASYSNGATPAGTSFTAMLNSVMDLIDNAQSTIDVAMYNSNRPDIIYALEQAMQRGVRVRYIGDGGQSNSALDPLPDFPLLFRNGDGIMHHKFLIIDPHDPDRATVWTGSTNHSSGQLASDPNNALVIQDQAIAKAYLHEFEEMWGGSANSPNPLLSRTGSAKRDDTPHLFRVGDIDMESYFSPSDNTNRQILSELETSEESIDVALLLLTRYDLAAAMTDRAAEGVRVRVIVDDLESSAYPLQLLQSGGVWTAHHDFNSIFHHKYAILDDGQLFARVITGSHNWTTSATVRNDENTLIVHDPDIANIYRQEFEARWTEVFISGVHDKTRASLQIVPNPASDVMYVESEEMISSGFITSIAGKTVMSEANGNMIDISSLLPGMYILTTLLSDGSRLNTPFVKTK